ncbi:MAG TPA: hypothetical protein VD735_06215, partial [Candidatus Saccharimonadales bacterium]|nr:hypothetical protein [Candidatus Saccharimonadales bacterium]
MELQGADYLNTAFAELRHLEPEALQALAQLAMCPPDTAALPPSMQEAPATERAARVDAVLEQQLRARRERVLAYAPFKRNLEEFGPDPDAEIEGQDTMPWGFHADPKWLHDIAAHIIEAKPLTIWLDNALVDIIPERSPTGRFTGFRPDHVEIARDSQTLLAGASLLQDVSAAIRSPRIRVMLQRSVGYTPQVEQVQEVLVLRALREQGIIDERGHDVGVLRLRDYEGRVGNIITLLQQNGGGQVYEGVGGVLLDQADWLQEWNRLRFAGHDGSRSKVPIQLTSGHASPWSAGFMSEADEGMHVVLGSGAYSVSADILKAAGSMKRDMFHMIGMREHWRGPEFRAYQLGRLLQREVRRYIKASSTVVDFNTFSAGDYMQKNYPEVMEQDKDIQRVQVRTAAKVAEQLGVDLERPETLLGDDEVLHVCVGSNLYPVMLREHLSAGRIKGIDIAPSVKRYMDRVRDGLHDGHWQLHEDEMVRAANECGIDPALFIGSRDRANQKLEVVIG